MSAVYQVGQQGRIAPADEFQIDSDPRGLLFLIEPPNPSATYVMGIDPSVGIVNWDRLLRSQDDIQTDNGAIEILRVGRSEPGLPDFIPDRQVAEFAAPVDPETLADVANLLGRIYAGNSEDGQCLSIIEVYPGPGLLTLRRMIERHGYTNQYIWRNQWDALVAKTTSYYGWTANTKTVRDLWIKCSRHVQKGGVRVSSPWLVEEWADCEMDPNKMYAKAMYGSHDDRVRAINLSIWAAHDWSFDVETQVETVQGGPAAEWQASDCTAEMMYEQWEERFAKLFEG